MEKGLEITFKIDDEDASVVAEALTNMVGNEFLNDIDIDWRIFHITLEDNHFFKICFIGPKMTKLHPLIEKKVKTRFDELSHYNKNELLKMYHKEKKNKSFKTHYMQEKKEEYDLWQDNFWSYF